MQQHPVRQSTIVQQPMVVGKPLPRDVVLTPIAEDPRYAYTIVNDQTACTKPPLGAMRQVLSSLPSNHFLSMTTANLRVSATVPSADESIASGSRK
ncbi:DUF1236 domain-containing protein [Pararhizobium sp. BT-229]|uniref:DUF1236 domain-containing protein n=1 Tax=Pararhizobium sp. BT-229 TaxID=2986923 RepID=UPI003556257A